MMGYLFLSCPPPCCWPQPRGTFLSQSHAAQLHHRVNEKHLYLRPVLRGLVVSVALVVVFFLPTHHITGPLSVAWWNRCTKEKNNTCWFPTGAGKWVVSLSIEGRIFFLLLFVLSRPTAPTPLHLPSPPTLLPWLSPSMRLLLHFLERRRLPLWRRALPARAGKPTRHAKSRGAWQVCSLQMTQSEFSHVSRCHCKRKGSFFIVFAHRMPLE